MTQDHKSLMKHTPKGKLIWKPEKEQVKEFENIKATRDITLYGRDGKIVVAEGRFTYKGIPYLVKVLRYFNLNEGFKPMGSDRISDKHAVLEYPDELAELVSAVNQINECHFSSDFLYADTLHIHNDKQSIEEQIAEMHEIAEGQIDSINSKKLSELIKEKTKALNDLRDRIKLIAKKLGAVI